MAARGAPGTFPETRDTLVASLASEAPADRDRALDMIARAYHEPVVKLLQRRAQLARPDAEDLAQEFFARAIEKSWFARYDATRGRFRPFLRRCLEDFWHAAARDASRLKRGGAATHLPLDEHAVPAAPAELDRLFEVEWARSVLSIAGHRLEAESVALGKEVAWECYLRYDLTDAPDAERPTYAALASALGIPATQVTNHLAWARRRMRDHVLDTVRALTGDEADYRAEVAALLGGAGE